MKDQYEQVMNATEILKDNSFIKLDDKDPEITHPSAGQSITPLTEKEPEKPTIPEPNFEQVQQYQKVLSEKS